MPHGGIYIHRLLIYHMLPLAERSSLTLFIHMYKHMPLLSQKDHRFLISYHRSITLYKLSHNLLCILFSG